MPVRRLPCDRIAAANSHGAQTPGEHADALGDLITCEPDSTVNYQIVISSCRSRQQRVQWRDVPRPTRSAVMGRTRVAECGTKSSRSRGHGQILCQA